MNSRDKVHIKNLTTHCIVGVLPEERLRPQRLRADIKIELSPEALTPAALSGELGLCLDYAGVAAELKFILAAGHFRLLETACLCLCHYLLAPPLAKAPRPHRVRVTLAKPEALGGSAVPGVSLTRTLAALKPAAPGAALPNALPPGTEVLFYCQEMALHRISQAAFSTHAPDWPVQGFTEQQDFLVNQDAYLRLSRF